MKKSAIAPLRQFATCLTLTATALFGVATANAQQVGVLTASVSEKLKINRCGSLFTNPYPMGFLLHTNGLWDMVDIETGDVLAGVGTFAGPLESRKFRLSAGGLLTSAYISVLTDAANSNCGTDIVVTSNTPLNYMVKINKQRTVAKIKSEMKMRGFDYYSGRTGKATYTLQGTGTYAIADETAL